MTLSRSLPCLLVCPLMLVSCGDDSTGAEGTDGTDGTGSTDGTAGASDTGTTGGPDGTTAVDGTLTGTDSTGESETGTTGTEPTVPMIDEVLDCGTSASAGGLAPGNELDRYDLDLSRFPDAMCNDGTPGFFYYRPPATEEGADKWVIQLQGGGGCRDAASCLARWCSVDTNFGMTQMTANDSPQAINGRGILDRRPENPIANAHQVFIRYCSSDAWQGQRNDVVLTGPHPVTGEEVSARVHFRGASIVDAVVTSLEEDFDLTAASSVVVAGASAGGSGVITHVDALQERLLVHNPNLQFRVLHDSNFSPAAENLDYGQTKLCQDAGLCDWATHFAYEDSEGVRAMRGSLLDQSCLDWHAGRGDTWACVDLVHVLLNHVTAPMMVRMSQTDTLISDNMIEQGYVVDGMPLDLPLFAQLVREQAATFAQAVTTAEEGTAIQSDPALFVPTCPKHETISHGASTYDVTIDVNGTPQHMFDVMQAWLSDGAPRVAIAATPADNVCP